MMSHRLQSEFVPGCHLKFEHPLPCLRASHRDQITFLLMATDSKTENNHSAITVGIFITALVLLSLTIVAYLGHMATSGVPKNVPTDISIRPATPEDYPLYFRLYPAIGTDHPPVALEEWLKYEMSMMSIITRGTTSVGYTWAFPIGENYRLAHFVIAEEHRGKGIGTVALRLVKKVAREKGFKRWGLHCEVQHEIPYRMYIKAGMQPKGKGFYLTMPSESIASLAPAPIECSLTVALDASHWAELENVAGIMSGEITSLMKIGAIPLVLYDPDKSVRAFAMYDSTSGFTSDLYVKDAETTRIFLKLIHDYKQPVSKGENVHDDRTRLWIPYKNSIRVSNLVMETIPGAAITEEYDYLEGSTTE